MVQSPSGQAARRPTIRDVARLAGVSTATVSYVLNGTPGQTITASTRERVRRAADSVGYVPHRIARALREHPTRFVASLSIDPNDITGAVRRIREAKADHDIKAVTSFPAGCDPQVPVSDRRYYPVFQTCIDLDIPIVLNAGVPGPRVPGACQDVAHFDEVCYDFPELRIVMRHGAEPQEDLAVKLMLKWPNLHYSTSAFAPRYYPKAIVDYANTRGADRIIYGGYFPASAAGAGSSKKLALEITNPEDVEIDDKGQIGLF